MVCGLGVPVGADAVEHREVDDPDVAVRALADRGRTDGRAQQAQHLAGGAVLVGDGQDEVAGAGCGRRQYPGGLGLREVTGQWAVEAGGIGDPEPGQAGGARLLGLLGQLIEPLAWVGSAFGHDDGLDRRRAEGLDVGGGEGRGQVDQLHAEAQVGLVGAVAVEGVGPRHALDRRRPLAGGRLGRVEHGLGD